MKKICVLFLTLVSFALAAKAPIPKGGFRSCSQAHAAGYGDIRKGEPAYSKKLDRDGDGIACEWNRRRR